MIVRVLAASVMLLNVAAAEPKMLAPTGKWMVEFADHDCILSRHYGTGPKDALILSFKKLPMETGIEVYVFKSGKKHEMRAGKAKLAFGAGQPAETRYGAYLAGTGLRTINLVVEDESYRAAIRSGVVHVSVPREVAASFAVPGIGPALQLLDQCALNLGELWGIPKEQQQRMSTAAKLTMPWHTLFVSSDYPAIALKEDASGRSIVRYAIDESGRPSDCVVLKSSGNSSLDSRACSVLMKRARFEPARDREGKPMRSLAVTGINWLLYG